ncbi:MAG: hypothetical protein RLZZ232_1984 [Planctomycetota bacterium]|jgi:hypothetical protein
MVSAVLFNLSLITEYCRGDVIAVYSFDNSTVSGSTLNDLSGNNHDGMISANVTSGQSGRFGESFYFDATNLQSEVKIPYAGPKFGNTFTFSYWMNVAAGDLNRPGYLLLRGTNTSQNALIFAYNSSTAEIFVPERTGADPRGDSGLLVQAGVWNHLAYTYDGATLRKYLNGTQTGSTAIVFDLTATGNIYLGSAGDEFGISSANYRGYLDDVSIWDEALSSAQVSNLYNSPALASLAAVPEPSSIALWSVVCLATATVKLWRRKGGIPSSAI